ncbi:MAG: hypothetical protein AAF234_20080 [Pseudomonadota bacterium]
MNEASDISIADQLLRLETTKTWSLIATVFGDLEEDHISGKALRNLLEPLNIKPEAMRVALHRLKKDGWIVSEKNGREMIYRLSDHGRQETRAAREDVYRRDVKFPDGWRVVLLPSNAAPIDDVHISLERSVYLAPKGAALPRSAVELAPPDVMPNWFAERLVPDQVLQQAAALTDLATQFLTTKPTQASSVSIRLMFLHYWRRMALRTGVWAHIGLFPTGVMSECHAAMCKVFDQTQRTRPSP